MDGLGLTNYSQNLRLPGVYLILTLLILLPIISHVSLPISNPKLRNNFQPNQQFRLRTNLENLDRDLVWNRTYNISPYDRGYAIVECQTGGFALFGETEDNQSQTDLLLIRVDTGGNVLWNSSFGTIENEIGVDFVECLDGGFVLLGYRDREMFLIRTNSLGHLQWQQSFFSSSGPCGISIVRCQTGGFAVLYDSLDGWTWLLRLDDAGVQLWNRTYYGRPYWGCDVFVECQDGGFAFMGPSFNGNPFSIELFRTDSVGNLLWDHFFVVRDVFWGFGLVECEDGGFAFTGRIEDRGINVNCLYLGRTDHLGELMWNNTYGEGCGYSILQINSGEFVITGNTVGVIPSYDDVSFYIFDSSGTVLINWELGGAYSQRGNSIIECRDGGFAIIGETYDEADFSNVLLIRFPKARLDPFQRFQWYGVVIVLPILVSVIIVIMTIRVFKLKKATLNKKKQS